MPSAMDKKTGLNLGYAVFAALAVLPVHGEGNSGSPPAFYTLGADHADHGKAVTPADMLARGSVAYKQADALRAAVAAAAR